MEYLSSEAMIMLKHSKRNTKEHAFTRTAGRPASYCATCMIDFGMMGRLVDYSFLEE
jgi:hypothetical protein